MQTPLPLSDCRGNGLYYFVEAAMEKLDLKKTLKSFYNAKNNPVFVNIPAFKFLMVDGTGNPNTSIAYTQAIQALYSLAYTLKFKIKKEHQIDYPVMSLEGLWWGDDMHLFSAEKKDDWRWTMMISIPEFISSEQVEIATTEALNKNKLAALPLIRLETFEEGQSAQLMHVGPYSAEKENIQRLHAFIHAGGYSFDGLLKKHHEIYISDPRKTAPEKLKTIIRQPVITPQHLQNS
jgi:hypothetical protein